MKRAPKVNSGARFLLFSQFFDIKKPRKHFQYPFTFFSDRIARKTAFFGIPPKRNALYARLYDNVLFVRFDAVEAFVYKIKRRVFRTEYLLLFSVFLITL